MISYYFQVSATEGSQRARRGIVTYMTVCGIKVVEDGVGLENHINSGI